MKQNVYDYSYELRRTRKRKITFVLTLIISVILFISLFLNFVLFPVLVNSHSMESDVVCGGSVFIAPLSRNPRRGDVVYLARQDGARLSFFSGLGNVLIKFFTVQKYSPFEYTRNITGKPMLRRVVALPGDKIKMKDYILYVNPGNEGQYLSEYELSAKPYNTHIYSVPAEWDGIGSCGDMDELVLGENEYFVLADNRVEGTDSRVWGPVTSDKIKGRAVIEYFPFNKIRFF